MKDVNTTRKWEFFFLFLNSKRTFDLLRVHIVVHLVSLNSHRLNDKHQTDGNRTLVLHVYIDTKQPSFNFGEKFSFQTKP